MVLRRDNDPSTTNLRHSADFAVLLTVHQPTCGQTYCGNPAATLRKDCVSNDHEFLYQFGRSVGGNLNVEAAAEANECSGVPYARGKLFQTGYRTIMTYHHPHYVHRVNYFSSPNVIVNGSPTGDADADMVRFLNENNANMAAVGDQTWAC